MSLDDYVQLLRQAVGTEFHNEWSPGMHGPRFPRPLVGFNAQVTRDSIRHLVDAVGDLNPLYRSTDYAAKTKYGVIIAPPTILYGVAYGHYVDPLVFPTSPDFPNTYGGDAYEWFCPLCEGDDVDFTTTMPTRVEVKETRAYGKTAFVWGIHEFHRRQGGIPLARCTFLMVVRPRQRAQMAAEARSAVAAPSYTEEFIRELYAAQDREVVRGAEPRLWEDVEVGSSLTPVVRGPHSVMDRVAWIAAAIGERFFVSDRINRFTVEHSGWGTWDPDLHEYRNFHDDMFAADYQGSFGAQRSAWIAMALTNWMGDDGFLWKLSSQHRIMGGNAWVFTCEPRVTGKYILRGRHCVDVDCPLTNQDGTVVTTATASIILPSHENGPVSYPFPGTV
jgi:acyl dehydratase